jgi:hypothetical protein
MQQQCQMTVAVANQSWRILRPEATGQQFSTLKFASNTPEINNTDLAWLSTCLHFLISHKATHVQMSRDLGGVLVYGRSPGTA